MSNIYTVCGRASRYERLRPNKIHTFYNQSDVKEKVIVASKGNNVNAAYEWAVSFSFADDKKALDEDKKNALTHIINALIINLGEDINEEAICKAVKACLQLKLTNIQITTLNREQAFTTYNPTKVFINGTEKLVNSNNNSVNL